MPHGLTTFLQASLTLKLTVKFITLLSTPPPYLTGKPPLLLPVCISGLPAGTLPLPLLNSLDAIKRKSSLLRTDT